jgi:hypothetical protein
MLRLEALHINLDPLTKKLGRHSAALSQIGGTERTAGDGRCSESKAVAKRAVEQELRGQGVRVTLVKPAEINQRATAYIASHPEVWAQALERARKIYEAEEARKAARRKKRSHSTYRGSALLLIATPTALSL